LSNLTRIDYLSTEYFVPQSGSWRGLVDLRMGTQAAPAELMQLMAPADNDLLGAFPVTRDRLKIKEPGPSVLTTLSD
jgi:hypothetical protein